MKLRFSLAFLLATYLHAATETVYLRTTDAPLTITAASVVASTVRLTVSSSASFEVGDYVRVDGLKGCSSANGTRKVSAKPSGTTLEIQTIADANIACNSAFSTITATYLPRVGKATSYTLVDYPRVFADGPGGTVSTRIAANDITGWPPYDGLAARAATCATFSITTGYPECAAEMALHYYLTGNTTSRDGAISHLNNVEKWRKHFGMAHDRTHGGRAQDFVDWASFDQYFWGLAYSFVQGSMSAGEKSAFAAKMLDDRGDSCTNQITTSTPLTGTVATTSTTVTGTGTDFVADGFAAGDHIMVAISTTSSNHFEVVSVESATSMTITGGSTLTSGKSFYRAAAYVDGHCGDVWGSKHHTSSILSNNVDYPASGGSNTWNRVQNLSYTKAKGFMAIGLALLDDPRGKELVEGTYAYLYDEVILKHVDLHLSGVPAGGTGQYWRRNPGYVISALRMLKLAGGPDLLSSRDFHQEMLQILIYNQIAARPTDQTRLGDTPGSNMAADDLEAFFVSLDVAPNSDNTKYFYDWLETDYPYWLESHFNSSSRSIIPVLTMDATPTKTDHTSQTLQRLWRRTEDGNNAGMALAISRTSWSDTSGTNLVWQPSFGNLDHQGVYHGHVQLNKAGGHFWGHDVTTAHGTCIGSVETSCFQLASSSTAWQRTNAVWVGASEPATVSQGYMRTASLDYGLMQFSVDRWAGTDPTGVANNKYVYGRMAGLGNGYSNASPPRAYEPADPVVLGGERHVAHLKGGSQDWVVVYDDYRMNGSSYVPMGQWYFTQNSETGEGNTTLSTDTITSDWLTNARVTGKIIHPSSNLRAVLGNGSTAGVKWLKFCMDGDTSGACDATDTAQYLTAWRPCANVTCTMPTTVAISESGWKGVEIQDATSPAVVAFATGGSTASSLTIITTHAGTAEYMLAGLTPGVYDIELGGVAVTGSPFTVASGDSSVYFTSAAGEITVVSTGVDPVQIDTTTLPNGTLDQPYSQAISVSGGTPPYTCAVTSGAAPTGLAFDSDCTLAGTPSAAGAYTFTVTATDAAMATDAQAYSGVEITDSGVSGLAIAVIGEYAMPLGSVSQTFVAASGGDGSYTYSIASGALPSGVSINSSTGGVSGTCSAVGNYSVTARVTDGLAATADIAATLRCSPVSNTTTALIYTASNGLVAQVSGCPDANQSIKVVYRDTGNNLLGEAEVSGGPATRRLAIVTDDPPVAGTVQISCGSTVGYSAAVTFPASASNLSVLWQSTPPSGWGITHVRLRYGGTVALGSTSSCVVADGSPITLTRDSGILYLAHDWYANDDCSTAVADGPVEKYAVVE